MFSTSFSGHLWACPFIVSKITAYMLQMIAFLFTVCDIYLFIYFAFVMIWGIKC